jgi:hypothetical protein
MRPFANCRGLSEADFTKGMEMADVVLSEIVLLNGNPLILVRRVVTRARLAPGRRCNATDMGVMTVVVQFEDDQTRRFTRIALETASNGVRVVR